VAGALRGLWRRATASLRVAIGDVTFGMEDGAVSVAGLVFGVSAGTNDSRVVVLAGATGAVAGAVSMMAGRYLDVQSTGHRSDALLVSTRHRVETHPAPYLARATARLRAAGFTPEEAQVVHTALARNPQALADHVIAYELGTVARTEGSPLVHALWMFFADLLAASVPVIPFVLFPLDTARLVSLVVTGLLMAVLGVARGRIGGVNIWRTAVETMAIAGAAALAGVAIGHLVS
jgi:VIT1/CCC1 family predicted Fe2+/Mn2+ transporter